MNPIDFFDNLPGIDLPAPPAMRAIFRAAYGDPLSDEDRAHFDKLSGGRNVPPDASEIAICAGRGSTKTSVAAARFLVFEATQIPHAVALSPGQKGICAIVSTEKTNQSAELLNACRGLCELPAIKRLVTRMTADEIEFSTGIIIRKLAADSKLLRGSRYVAVVLDEAAFLGWDGVDPDDAIVRSLRGGMVRIEGAPRRKLLAVSSANVKRGWFYDTITDCHGKDDAPTLAFHGGSLDYNPHTSREDLAAAKARDPIGYLREYESVFMDIVQHGFFASHVIDRSVDLGRSEPIAHDDGARVRIALDVAWSSDGFAVAVAQTKLVYADDSKTIKKRITTVLDVQAWKGTKGAQLSPTVMMARVSGICRRYDQSSLVLDQFNAQPLIEMLAGPPFRIKAKRIDWHGGDAVGSKGDRFRAVREAMIAGDLRLPDLPGLRDEFERIASKALPTGGDRIEAVRGHDDQVCAVVLAVSELLATPARMPIACMTHVEASEKRARDRRLAFALGASGKIW